MVGTPLSRNSVDLNELNDGLKPFWTIEDFAEEKDVLDWCKKAVDACEKHYAGYFSMQFQNLLIYQGCHWLSQDKYSNRWLDNVQKVAGRRTPRVVFNHCYDFVEHHVSRATRYKPAVSIFPANPEQKDADDAKIAKDVLDYIWYVNNVDMHQQQMVRYCKIFGEAFLKIDYNFNKGDIHPDWAKLVQQGQRVPVLDAMGQPVNGADGNPLLINKAVKTGEVDYTVKAPWHYFEEPVKDRYKMEWAIEWELENVDYLKAKYPVQSADIKADSLAGYSTTTDFDFYGQNSNQTVVYTLYHRCTEMLSKGRMVKFTREVVLENTDLPFSHGGFPWVKIHDIDVPDCIRGMSFFQQIFPINHQINACGSLIYKMLVLYAHPKICMPDGAAEMNQLMNDSTVITYQNGVPPTLLNMSPPIGEPMGYMDKLESIMQKLGGNFEMSRGSAPDGVRAAKALRVLDEQEDKRSFAFITKFNQIAMVDNAKMSLSVAGDYYDDSDGRLARVVGGDNEYRIRKFEAANLSKPYDIRIESTTALSQSPAARIEEINEMMAVRFDPSAPISREQYYNLLNLNASDQFKDIVSRAAKCAASENDDLLRGETIQDPTEDEDLVIHWKVHLQVPQGRDFKEITPEDRKARFRNHVAITEYLMFEKAYGIMVNGIPLKMGNPAFAQRLAIECPNWPVYFEMPAPGMAPQMPMPMGAEMLPPPGQTPATMPPAPLDPGMPLDTGASVETPGMNIPPIGQ